MFRRLGDMTGMRTVALAALPVLALAGCSSGGADPGDTIGNIFAFNSARAPAVEPPKETPGSFRLICPIVELKDGNAAHRVFSGSGTASTNVRYQFSVGETARECTRQDSQIIIKVGVEGKVLLGPAGAPSSFTVPVYIGVRRDADQQIVVSKVYNVQAAIPAGSAQTTFSVVSEPLAVPYISDSANMDYSIFVGFERPAQPQRTSQRRRR